MPSNLKKTKLKTPKRKYAKERAFDIDDVTSTSDNMPQKLKRLTATSNKDEIKKYVSAKEDELHERASSQTSESLRKTEVDSIFSLIEFLLENNDKLTDVQENKLREFLEQDDNNITPDNLTNMRKYIDSIIRNTNRSIKPNPVIFTEGMNQTVKEAKDVLSFILYTLRNKIKTLSEVQKQILRDYSTYIIKRDVNITENEVISIQNHIRSAIYKEKTEIMNKINDMMVLYPKNVQKQRILNELKKELDFLVDEYLSKADSDYFTEQLKLLQTGKYIIREHLIDLVDEEFLNKIGKYPDSYIDKVNKLKTKIRRKPFILPHKYKDKIMNKLKQITRVNKFLIF